MALCRTMAALAAPASRGLPQENAIATRLHATALPPAAHGRSRQQLPASVGECFTERVALDSGLVVLRSRYRPAVDLVEESAPPPGNASTLVVTLGLSGESGYVAADGARLGFRAGHTTVSAFRQGAGERHFRAGSSVAQLRLLVDMPLLARYLGRAPDVGPLRPGSVRELGFGPSTAASCAHAAALVRQFDAPAPDLLAMHIHALSLLAEQRSGVLGPPAAPAAGGLPPEDVLRLEQLRDLMHAQMDRPLSLASLCAAAGMGESRLKAAWQRLFGSSPLRTLTEIRMRRARTLLEAGGQVAQVAWQVGYAHPNNFSAAFTRFHGRTPKSVAGRRG